MKPINFKKQNIVFANDQPNYLPLPAHKTIQGVVTTCWKMSFFEKLYVLFTGRIWIQLNTFNQPLHPIQVGCRVVIQDPTL